MESTILATIASAVAILKDAPEALQTVRRLGTRIDRWISMRFETVEIDPNSPSGMVLDGLGNELKDLIKKFFEAEKSGRHDQAEKDALRGRIATKACSLINAGERILKRHIPDLDDLKDFFCNFKVKIGL